MLRNAEKEIYNYNVILKVDNLPPDLIMIDTVTVNKQNKEIYVLFVATDVRTAVEFLVEGF